MAVQWCNTDGIARCSMSRAILEALNATIRRLLTQYCPSGRQGDSKQNNDAKCVHFASRFDGRGGAPVLSRASPNGGGSWLS